MMASSRDIVSSLMTDFGQTYASEAGIHIEQNTPAPLFQLLVLSILLSSRISAKNAMQATRALFEAGLTTPKKMAEATWQDRVDVLTANGYKRFDESGSRMLGESAQLALDEYHGDLRELRERAERDVERERELLQEFKGIGPVGADIFLREVQRTWDEVYPYADARVLDAAEHLGLSTTAEELSHLVSESEFPALTSALVRVALGHAYDDVPQPA